MLNKNRIPYHDKLKQETHRSLLLITGSNNLRLSNVSADADEEKGEMK